MSMTVMSMKVMRRICGGLLFVLSSSCYSHNCSNLTILGLGDVWMRERFDLGTIFAPTFNAGFVAQYEMTSGKTATYSFPNSVTAYATTASPIVASLISGSGQEFYVNGYYDEIVSRQYFHLSKSGQGCLATLRATPLSGTTIQNIGGMVFTVGIQGGRTVTATGTGSTVDNLSIDRLRHNSRVNLDSMAVSLSTAGYVTITVPDGTPDGLYAGQFTLPYSTLACVGNNRCSDNGLWQRAATSGAGTLRGEIRIRVSGGVPVNPDIHCQQLTPVGPITLSHGSLTPVMAPGNTARARLVIGCTGGDSVPVTISIKNIGNPNTGSQLSGNVGILTPLTNGMDSKLTVEGRTKYTTSVGASASFSVQSELVSGSILPAAGKYEGNGVVTIAWP